MTHPDLPPKGLMAKLARRQDRHSGQLVLPEGGLVASFLSGRFSPGFSLFRLNWPSRQIGKVISIFISPDRKPPKLGGRRAASNRKRIRQPHAQTNRDIKKRVSEYEVASAPRKSKTTLFGVGESEVVTPVIFLRQIDPHRTY